MADKKFTPRKPYERVTKHTIFFIDSKIYWDTRGKGKRLSLTEGRRRQDIAENRVPKDRRLKHWALGVRSYQAKNSLDVSSKSESRKIAQQLFRETKADNPPPIGLRARVGKEDDFAAWFASLVDPNHIKRSVKFVKMWRHHVKSIDEGGSP